ncbi:hypothetical protein FG87_14735 [Nocardia vulneris]|uniref:Uncharacterized protein n=1 Tax=Nocardia vulneris TaxID=1141657 RepID=A0ABR4ZGI0_9NOCA|nr:hypothetical protein FG87_14735 [Nocardia vulneris]
MMFALATAADVSEPDPAGVPAAHADVVPPHAATFAATLGFSARPSSAQLDAVRQLNAHATSSEQWRRAFGDAIRGWAEGRLGNPPVQKLSPSSCG